MVSFILVLSSCYYDIEENLYPTIECSTEDMSYMVDVLPIISENCLVCHSASANFGNVTLEGYDNFIKKINSGELLGAINHESGFSPMPKNQAQLLKCEIEKIEAWVTQGALNN